MAIVFGFDSYDYPGDEVMKLLLAETPIRACGAYLGPTPSHKGTTWMAAIPELAGMGYTVFPVFVGAQTEGPGARLTSMAEGAVHAHLAYTLANKCKLADDVPVFLDIENGPPASKLQSAYIQQWVDTMVSLGRKPGVYCSYELVPHVLATVQHPIAVWAFHLSQKNTVERVLGGLPAIPASTGGGYPGAAAWQFMQNVLWHYPGATKPLRVDFNVFDTSYRTLPLETPAPASA